LTEARKEYYPLEVNFGDEELNMKGTTKITKTIFEGTSDKTENAIVFLDNLEKALKNPDGEKPLFDDERFTQASSAITRSGESKSHNSTDRLTTEESVILNISPKKYDKPRDQLFIDFFSMYTK
jgi:hypothetical protein